MNRQVYSVLFSILLASTLVHEIRAKAPASALLNGRRAKRNADSNCSVGICKGVYPSMHQTPKGLYVCSHKKTTSILAFHQESSSCMMISPDQKIAVFNLEQQTVCYSNKKEMGLDDSVDMKDWVNNLDDFGAFSGVSSFPITSAPNGALDCVKNSYPHFFSESLFSLPLSLDIKEFVQVMCGVFQGIFESSTILKEVFRFRGSTSIQLSNGIASFVDHMQAFKGVFAHMGGSLSDDKRNELYKNIPWIMNQDDGMACMAGLMKYLGPGGGSYFDAVKTFEIMGQMEGPGSIWGPMSSMASCILMQRKFEVVMSDLLRFNMVCSHTNRRTTNAWSSWDTLKKTIQPYQGSYSQCATVLTQMRTGNFILNGINLSNIFSHMSRLEQGASFLEIVVLICLELKPIISIEVCIRSLVGVIVILVNGPFRALLLKSVVKVNPLQQVLFDLLKLKKKIFHTAIHFVKILVTGDIYGACLQHSVLSPLISLLQKILLQHGYNLRDIMNNEDSRDMFFAIFKLYGVQGQLSVSQQNLQKASALDTACNDYKNQFLTRRTISSHGVCSGRTCWN